MNKLLIILFLPVLLYSQTTYYVKDDGNDGNTGLSDAQAWLTLSKVQSTVLVAGDSVLFKRGDTWTGQQMILAESGTLGNEIYIGAYSSGANPIIDGNNAFNNYIIRINGSDYIILHNLTVRNVSMTGGGNLRGAIDVEEGSVGITIRACTLSVNTTQQFHIWAGGIVCLLDPVDFWMDSCDVSGTYYGVFVLNNYENSHIDASMKFTNNYFHDFDPRVANPSDDPVRGRAIAMMTWYNFEGGSSPDDAGDPSQPGSTFGAEGTIKSFILDNNTFEGIMSNCVDWYWHVNFVTAGVKGYGFQITDNTVNDNAFNFIDFAGIGWRGGLAARSIVSGNVIDSSGWDADGNLFSIPGEGFVNVIQTHNWDNVIIENNTIRHVAQTSGDGNGIIMDYSNPSSSFGCDSIVIRNNFVAYCQESPDLGVGETAGAAIQLFVARYAQVYGNILVGNHHGIALTIDTENALIYNNTIDSSQRDTHSEGGAGIYSGGDLNTDIRNNIITNCEGKGIRKGGTQTGFLQDYNLRFNNNGQDGSGANDVLADPLYIGGGDYALQETSPAIDAGVTITGDILTRSADYIGTSVPINSIWDIGSYEWFEDEPEPPISGKIRVLLWRKQ